MSVPRLTALILLIAAVGFAIPVNARSEPIGLAIQDTSQQRGRAQPAARRASGRAPVSGAPAIAAPGAIPMLPDLVVEGPVVSDLPPDPSQGAPNIVWHGKRHEWTVRNVGTGDAPSTQLRFRCQDSNPPEEAYCAKGDHNWGNVNQPIPPLGQGSTFKVSSESYMSSDGSVMTFQEVKPDDNPTAPGTILPYAIRFTATIDPEGQVSELNENNNQTTFDDAFGKVFGAPAPLAQVRNLPNPPGLQTPPAPSVAIPGGPQILPELALSTEKPWTPGTETWLLAKNVGGFDAPPSQVTGECVNHTAIEWNQARQEHLKNIQEQIDDLVKSNNPYAKALIQQLQATTKMISPPMSPNCDFGIPVSIPVPALKNGESQGIFLLKTHQMDEYKYTITLQPPKGAPLILQN